MDTGDLLAEKTFFDRGILQTQHHPTGDFRMPTFPVRFDGKPPAITPAPLLGEHSEEVARVVARNEPRGCEGNEGRGVI